MADLDAPTGGVGLQGFLADGRLTDADAAMAAARTVAGVSPLRRLDEPEQVGYARDG